MITLYKAKPDPDPYWSEATFQVEDVESETVKRFVKWWNQSKSQAQYVGDLHTGKRWDFELNNMGRSRFKVGWNMWRREGGTDEDILRIMNAAYIDFQETPPPEPKKKRRTSAEVSADKVKIPPIDPLLVETLQTDVSPYLAQWHENILTTYTTEWQKYLDWADARGRVDRLDKSPITKRNYGYSGLLGLNAYFTEEIYKQDIYKIKNPAHPLMLWKGWPYTELNKLLPKFKQIADSFVEHAQIKLLQAVGKYLPLNSEVNVTSVEHTRLEMDQGKIVGYWLIIYDNGSRKQLDTQIIWAGGYNIQQLHTRYLVHVRDISPVSESNEIPWDKFREILDRSKPERAPLGEGFVDRVKDVFKGGEPFDMDQWITALHNLDVGDIAHIIEATDVDVNEPVTIEQSLIYPLTAVVSNPELVKLLLSHEADPNKGAEEFPEHRPAKPFIEAVYGNFSHSVDAMLTNEVNKADPNLRFSFTDNGSVDNLPILSLAAFKGFTQVMQSLINAGADSLAVDNDGRDALTYAVFGNSMGAVRILKTEKAHLKMGRDQLGKNALDYAYEIGHEDLMKVIRKGSVQDYSAKN